jgi:hypothetical protein
MGKTPEVYHNSATRIAAARNNKTAKATAIVAAGREEQDGYVSG